MAGVLLAGGDALAQSAGLETPERVLPLEVTVNDVAAGIWPILSRGGALFAPAEAYATWRLQAPPEAVPITYKGLPYLPLRAIPGMQERIDEASQRLVIQVPASTFAATKLSRELSRGTRPSEAVPALFGNYDLNLAYASTSGKADLGALGEIGWSGPPGVFTQTFLGQRLGAAGSKLTRLQTAYRHDDPASGYTLTVGDSTSRASLLGRSAYFGGVQFGTNFGLAPGVNRQPIPFVAGETAAPSVVQLYVNDVLRQTSNVPAGPFTLDNLPALVGNGQVTVKVRDVLGRETLISQPFLITAELLAPGLNDWSAEIGALRKELGSADASYGPGFASGLWRRGLSTSLTTEARVEAGRERQAAGGAAVAAVGASWLVRAGAMASRDNMLGVGRRWILGLDRPAYGSSLSLSVEGNSRGFRGLGEDRLALPVRLQVAAQASTSGTWGTFGVGLALQRLYEQKNIATGSLNYGTTLAGNWQLNAYYSRAFSDVGGYTLGAILTIPLDRQTVTASSVQVTQAGTDLYTSVTHTPEQGESLAWRALVARQQTQRAEAGAYVLGPRGQVSADVSASPGQTNLRLGALGGLIYTAGKGYAVQRFDTGAALVEVAGYPNVGVGLGAQATTRTDMDGQALLPRLAPYVANPVRLDPNDLPLTAEVDSIELDAVPPWRSVAKITFPVRSGRGALLKIDFDDGEVAPPGAVITIPGDDKSFYVARRGEAYVTGLQPSNSLQLAWRGQRCTLAVALPPGTGNDIPRIGPLRCAGVAR